MEYESPRSLHLRVLTLPHDLITRRPVSTNPRVERLAQRLLWEHVVGRVHSVTGISSPRGMFVSEVLQ